MITAPRDLVFQEAIDAHFRTVVDRVRAAALLKDARDAGIPTRVAGATRRLESATTRERQAGAAFAAQLLDAAREVA